MALLKSVTVTVTEGPGPPSPGCVACRRESDKHLAAPALQETGTRGNTLCLGPFLSLKVSLLFHSLAHLRDSTSMGERVEREGTRWPDLEAPLERAEKQ